MRALARPWAGVRPPPLSARSRFLSSGRVQGTRPSGRSQLRTGPSPSRRVPAGPRGQAPGDRLPGQGLATLCYRSHLRMELYSESTRFFFLYCRIDPYGFERPEDFDYAAYEEFFSTYLAILTRRAIKWSKLLKGNNSVQKSMTGEFGAWFTMHLNRALAKKYS